MDLISNLPLHIIHKIMSYLSTRELAQTNLLSRKWKNNIRPTFPIFIFNQLDLGKDLPYFCPRILFKYHPEKFTESVEDFRKFVDSTLDQFCDRDEMKLRMQKFKLVIGITSNLESWYPLVDKWIGLALEHQVKNLNLHFQIFQNGKYPLPETVFLAKSINILKLYGCKLLLPSSNYAFKFHSLTKLKLEKVILDEQMIQKLTSNSPLLEDIDIVHCWGFAYCHVPNLPKLRTFAISSPVEDLTSIKIAAPNLRHCRLNLFDIKNPPYRISLAESCHLRILDLTGNLIADRDFDYLISKFTLLEELVVLSCKSLRKVTISSQTLKLLDIRECLLEAIHIDAPNLLEFFLFNYGKIPMASINIPCPWDISFEGSNDNVDTLWYLKLRKFLETSSPIEWLSIDIMVYEHSFNLEEFRQNSPPPPREIQELHLTVVIPESEYAAVLDAYFSVCHPKTLSLPTHHGDNERSNFYMWVYETLVNGDTYCCSCSNVKCWRHYLKDIKLESFHGKVAPPDSGEWKNEWRNLPEGTVGFALEWCFDVEND